MRTITATTRVLNTGTGVIDEENKRERHSLWWEKEAGNVSNDTNGLWYPDNDFMKSGESVASLPWYVEVTHWDFIPDLP